nr:hypothetical protein [Candidatus Njordarchaeum guaymaensis]
MSQTHRILTERRNILLTYGVAFIIGAIILIVGLWQSHWDFGVWFDNPFVFWTLIFSTTIVRLVAGFGLILTWIAIFELFLTIASSIVKARRVESLVKDAKTSDISKRERISGAIKGLKISDTTKSNLISEAYKGQMVSAVLEGKKGQKAKKWGVIFFLVIVPLAILVYALSRFILFWLYNAALTVTDVAILLIGIWGLMITVYLGPIARGEPITLTGKLAELRDRLREVEIKKSLYDVKNRILKLCQRKVKKELAAEEAPRVEDYAEAYSASHAQDLAVEYEKMTYEKVRETILAYRYRIRDDLLLPFALGSLIIPPIAFVFFVFWIRAFILRREVGRTLAERLIVLGGVLLAGLYASGEVILMAIYPVEQHSLLVALTGTYLAGAFIGCVIFICLVRKGL